MTYSKDSPQAERQRQAARDRKAAVNPNWVKAEAERKALADKQRGPKLTPRTRAHPGSIHARKLYERAKAKKLLCLRCNGVPVRGQIAKMGVTNKRPWLICIPCAKKGQDEIWSPTLRDKRTTRP